MSRQALSISERVSSTIKRSISSWDYGTQEEQKEEEEEGEGEEKEVRGRKPKEVPLKGGGAACMQKQEV